MCQLLPLLLLYFNLPCICVHFNIRVWTLLSGNTPLQINNQRYCYVQCDKYMLVFITGGNPYFPGMVHKFNLIIFICIVNRIIIYGPVEDDLGCIILQVKAQYTCWVLIIYRLGIIRRIFIELSLQISVERFHAFVLLTFHLF